MVDFLDLEVNAEDMINVVEEVDEKVKKTRRVIGLVDIEADVVLRRNIQRMRLSWGMLQGMIRAAGGSISMTQRLVISAGFGAVQALQPVLTAALGAGLASMNAYQVSQALLGLAELGSSIAALVAYQTGARDVSLQLRGINFMLSNMSMYLNVMEI